MGDKNWVDPLAEAWPVVVAFVVVVVVVVIVGKW